MFKNRVQVLNLSINLTKVCLKTGALVKEGCPLIVEINPHIIVFSSKDRHDLGAYPCL